MFSLQKTFNWKTVFSVASSSGILSSSFLGSHKRDYKIITNYNSQADLLFSLGISPDYYPYQLKKTQLYDYLINVDKYLVTNNQVSSSKQKLSKNLQTKLNSLFSKVKEFGEGLWDKTIYDAGLSHRNNEFWNQKQTSLLFLEQFVVDDYPKISDAYDILPTHKYLIITNHRASRDPFTVFGKNIFKCFKEDVQNTCDVIAKSFKEYVRNYNKVHVNSLYRFGRYIDFWNQLDTDNSGEPNFQEWMSSESLFSSNEEWDKEIAQKYSTQIFSPEELELLSKWAKASGNEEWIMNYLKTTPKLAHHSSLEEQTMPGSTPMAEGSQREPMLFLYQTAFLINKFVKNKDFKESFSSDPRLSMLEKATKHAAQIGKEIKERFVNIRIYFQEIGVVDKKFNPANKDSSDENSKKFGIVVFPPNSFGNGDSMMQTISRYPFLYKDIGLKQAIPDALFRHENHHHDHTHYDEEDIFSVDDHGWWWNLGNANLGNSKINEFRGLVDNLIVLANEDDWKLLSNSPSVKGISYLLQSNKGGKTTLVNNSYDLWNEGLKNPLALNLLLDSLVDMFQKEYDSDFKCQDKYSKAMEWGNYWSNTYLEGVAQ